jgi:NAD+ synthase
MSMHNIYTHIVSEIQKYFKTAGIQKAVIGVSGGIDSALCLKLTVDALSAANVTGILMPEKGVTNEENMIHAKKLCEFLKVNYHSIQINQFLLDFLAVPWKANDLAQINLKARVRMLILYSYANSKNTMVIGTSNKSELMLGYGTKYGDLAADIEVLGDLLKEDVYKLAEHVGLPSEFINKKPSAELYPGQTDEGELGLSYKEIDPVLKYLSQGMSKEEILNKGINPAIVLKIFRLNEVNSHKLSMPYLIKIKP